MEDITRKGGYCIDAAYAEKPAKYFLLGLKPALDVQSEDWGVELHTLWLQGSLR